MFSEASNERSSNDAYFSSRGEVTVLLQRVNQGESAAASSLLRVLYHDLRRVAEVRLADERKAHTFRPTDLVHEAYLRLFDEKSTTTWNSRRHFFSAVAEAMRRILIDHARKRLNRKHGGDHVQVALPDQLIPDQQKAKRLLALNDALMGLEQAQPQKAQLVKLRFFGGMTIGEAADVLGISTTTADRYWRFARAWLKTELDKDQTLDN